MPEEPAGKPAPGTPVAIPTNPSLTHDMFPLPQKWLAERLQLRAKAQATLRCPMTRSAAA
jgi:hypothetical protein